ncbi:MAG: winged helix-turn-helix transcriptional regulator [Solirubrobacteraceae bacterium]
MLDLDQIRRDIQARLEELLGEIERLGRALAALTSRESEPERSGPAAPVAGTATANESVATSARRAPRARKASVPPRPTAPTPASSAAAPTPARTAPGATKTAILAALKDDRAMTAGEIAAATGLARAAVSTTLSKLAASGAIAKAARGYQLQRESDTTRKPARPRPSVSTADTSPSPQAAQPQAAEPPAVEPPAVEPLAAEPPAVEPLAAEPTAELQAAEPRVAEPQAARPARSPARPAPGATKHAVLEALADGSAMTAGEVATATGLGRAGVSATLSKLAQAGELRNAARGYQIAGVEAAQRFYFRIEDDVTPRAVVANLPELEAAIAVCGAGVLRHHCAERDFSRWVAGVLHSEPLAAEIAAAEAQLFADSLTETVEHVRLALIGALQARHATQR